MIKFNISQSIESRRDLMLFWLPLPEKLENGVNHDVEFNVKFECQSAVVEIQSTLRD